MSGHNKWAKVKHVKAKQDAIRGRVFTRIIKEITIAARNGGGDEAANPRLRKAIQDAKAANMPANNIERAVKKGTGELEGVSYDEATYEGYAPGGAALIVDVVTDNKNRTVADIRHIFSKHGGNMAASGAVSWMFEKKGIFTITTEGKSEDELLEIALECGAEDLKYDPESSDILSAPADFDAVKAALEKKGLKIEKAEIGMYPKNTIKIEAKDAAQLLRFMDAIEEHDDVQHVYSNFDIDDEVLNQLQ
ncbi:YebC/PmpR family DNA-binding transcriptional regulator [candidate division KSB1 bacterium]|nr:YebC/PmpR family DNA-binding transcriptional regulator [candidate division KSB1 bacterium]